MAINPTYQEQEAAVRAQLEENGFVLLINIFTNDEEISEQFTNWQKDIVPDMHVYETTPTPQPVLEELSRYVQSVLPEITMVWNKTVRVTRGSFSLQHDEQPPAGILGAYFLSQDWDAELFRGELTLAADQPLLIPPQHNSLALISRTDDERVFIKKVTHYAETHDYTLVLVVWE